MTLAAPCLPCALQAARLTLVQILINARGLAMNPLQSLYYVSPACLLCLCVPFGEPRRAGREGWAGRSCRCLAMLFFCLLFSGG